MPLTPPFSVDKHPQMIRIRRPNITDTPSNVTFSPLTAALDDDDSDDSGVIYSINPANPHLHESVGNTISFRALLVLIGQQLSIQ